MYGVVSQPRSCETPTIKVVKSNDLTLDTVLAALVQAAVERDHLIIVMEAQLDPVTAKSALPAKELAWRLISTAVRTGLPFTTNQENVLSCNNANVCHISDVICVINFSWRPPICSFLAH